MSQFTSLEVYTGAGGQALGREVACAAATQIFKALSAKRLVQVA